jgi:ATP-dependent protease ClpP protease subunit
VKQAHVRIHGVIGSYLENGKEVKGVELLDIIAQVKASPDAQAILVHIKSPGGLVDEGDRIYDYLLSLKTQGIQVDTITDGNIGSIATKLFLAGDQRTIVEGHEFFIHNPWTQPQAGDSNQIALELQALKQTENNLRAFYQAHTKITDVGLKGLMDKETGMNAEQAVMLGFATQKIAGSSKPDKPSLKAFALLKSHTMPKESLTPGQKFGQMLDQILGFKKAEASEVKALDLEMDGGVKMTVNSEDPNNLVGADATMTDEAGAAMPAPDGEHKLADGRVLVVAAGKVTEVKPAPQANAPAPATPAPAAPAPVAPSLSEMQAKLAALEKANAQKDQELAALKSVNVQDQINKALDDFKATFIAGTTPRRGFNNMGGGNPDQPQYKSISEFMAFKTQERSKQLNKN